MKKNDFLKKWAKRASSGKSVEEFERDVEALIASSIKSAVAAVGRGIKEAAPRCRRDAGKILAAVANEILPAVERALMKVNGIEDVIKP